VNLLTYFGWRGILIDIGLGLIAILLWLGWPYVKLVWLVKTGRLKINVRRDDRETPISHCSKLNNQGEK